MDRTEIIAGLRDLADWLEQHPDAPEGLLVRATRYVYDREEFLATARKIGGDVECSGALVTVTRPFGPVTVSVHTEPSHFDAAPSAARDERVRQALEAALATEPA